MELFENPFSGLGGDVVLRFFYFSSGGLLFSGAEPLGNFGRESPKEHSCKIISKSIHRVRKRCLLSKKVDRGMMHDTRRTMDEDRSQKLTLSL